MSGAFKLQPGDVFPTSNRARLLIGGLPRDGLPESNLSGERSQGRRRWLVIGRL